MKIARVGARWLQAAIPHERQHVSDFGRVTSFDMALVEIEADDGTIGWGEGKAAVGSAGACAALVAVVEHELGPALIGHDPDTSTRCGSRCTTEHTTCTPPRSGRVMPALGRRGLTVSAISAIDMALWDVVGRSVGVPVLALWGGARHDVLPAYASGGWAGADEIGAQLPARMRRRASAR